MGSRIASDLHARGHVVAAAADIDPRRHGPLARVLAGATPESVQVGSLEEALATPGLDAAVVATSSDLAACAATFRSILSAGLSIVSTCEELVFPRLRHPALADELDALARAHGARLLGTGVNPGYVMDALPLFASAACLHVRHALVERIQDATTRRIPFQQKIGAGLSLRAFEARVAEGTLRHVGLLESLHAIAHGLGLMLDSWEETLSPVIASTALTCGLGPIAPGAAAGVRQEARGTKDGKVLVELVFQAAIAQPDPRDRIALDADPPIDMVLRGGVHGDVATSAIVVNALGSLLSAPPGLRLMSEIPLVRGAWARL